jgi:3-deoxy-7-phosphoheptulonate synthase / chorismate mutase
MSEKMRQLRDEIARINGELLALICRRGVAAQEIGRIKDELGLDHFDPKRESEMLAHLLEQNSGPFSNAAIAHLFKELFKASAAMMGVSERQRMTVRRKPGEPDAVLDLDGVRIGGPHFQVVAGPCAVESERQLDAVASHLRERGIRLLRAGAYKPRSSPYSFQGLREEGLEILARVAKRHGMRTVSEVVDTRDVEKMCEHVDVLQVGARNMQNFELLRLVGRCGKPVLLKRGFMSTLEEFVLAAEYIAMEGNRDLLLCERGIRTFERWTRNTLDLSAIPILKQEVPFPILVDLSHATGRKDLVVPLGRASIAAGADGVMVEVHDNPSVALSDSEQQLSLDEATLFLEGISEAMRLRATPASGSGQSIR